MFKIFLESIKLNCKIIVLSAFAFYTPVVFAQNIDSTDVENYNISIDLTKFKTQKLSGITEIKCKPLNGIKTKSITFMLLKLKVDSVFYRAYDSLTFLKLITPIMIHFLKSKKV